ncbi:MAG: beta-N-acetylhexosaminidase [Planctomycetota bacterium]
MLPSDPPSAQTDQSFQTGIQPMPRNLIVGLSGTRLTGPERDVLAQVQPAGVILFRRNVSTPDQVQSLCSDIRQAIGDDRLILVDEEGGRVQRLRPPVARRLPAAAVYGQIYRTNPDKARQAAKLIGRLTAQDLRTLGINTNCAPVADLRVPGAHDIVGDRSYGETIPGVVDLARAVAEGLMSGGVLPVVKHIPGHGRALCDSHHALPIVDAERSELAATDFETFKQLRSLPSAMTAHVVYADVDPEQAATVSKTVINDVVRRQIGFDGLLMTDDLSMKALQGTLQSRTEKALAAGCDLVLHCNGKLQEMEAVAAACTELDGRAAERFQAAVAVTTVVEEFDLAAAEACLTEIMSARAHTKDGLDPTA